MTAVLCRAVELTSTDLSQERKGKEEGEMQGTRVTHFAKSDPFGIRIT